MIWGYHYFRKHPYGITLPEDAPALTRIVSIPRRCVLGQVLWPRMVVTNPRFLVHRNASCWWKSVVHISTIFERLPSQTSTLPTNIIGFTLTNYYSGNLKDFFRLYRQVRFLCDSVVCASRWPKISHRWPLGFDTRGVWHNGSLKCTHSN